MRVFILVSSNGMIFVLCAKGNKLCLFIDMILADTRERPEIALGFDISLLWPKAALN
jgi:hypothetical protein